MPNPWAVVVPGGGAATPAATEDEALLSYVRSAAPGAQVVGSTGNGALVLAAADLLRASGRRSTGPSASLWRSWARSPPGPSSRQRTDRSTDSPASLRAREHYAAVSALPGAPAPRSTPRRSAR